MAAAVLGNCRLSLPSALLARKLATVTGDLSMAANGWKLNLMIGHGSVRRAVELWQACGEAGF